MTVRLERTEPIDFKPFLWLLLPALFFLFLPSLVGYSWELPIIRQLQHFSFLDHFLVEVSKLANPSGAVLFHVIPFCLWCVKEAMGFDMLVALVAADTANVLLKLVLRGDRPYWLFPELRQFEVTCETGYGMPSGHVMVATAIVAAMVRHMPFRKPVGAPFAVAVVATLALSRVFLAAHFITQVVAGGFCGLAIHALLLVHTFQATPTTILTTCLLIVTTALLLHKLTLLLPTTPTDSLTLATKACNTISTNHNSNNSNMITHRTHPVLSVVSRSVGIVLGSGWVLWSFNITPQDDQPFKWKRKALALVVGQMGLFVVQTSHTWLLLFCGGNVVLFPGHTILLFGVCGAWVVAVPRVVDRLLGPIHLQEDDVSDGGEL